MDYEKKYKDLVEAVKELQEANPSDEGIQKWVKDNVPELKESESIRLWLIELLSTMQYHHCDEDMEMGNKALAWLEKQGEQKPYKVEPKFKIGDVMRTLQEAADGFTDGMPVVVSIDKEYYHCTNELIDIKDQDNYEYPPKNREQKPAEWTEDDERNLDWLVTVCERIHYKSDPQVSPESALMLREWLKNLRSRVQPKQEWNEENEKMLEYAIDMIEWYSVVDKSKSKRVSGWLKSIRPQWKPSDEQIKALDIAIRCGIQLGTWEEDALKSLAEQLKKLREE